VFVAGSLRKPGCSFVQALAQGRTAAACADQYLRGEAVTGARKRFQSRMGRLREGEIEEFLKGAADIPRVVPRITPADTQADTPAGFKREEAAAEASRCLQCDCAAKESCRLRAYAEQYEARARHFHLGERRRFHRILQHPDVVFEPGKCIKCGICVRITARENEQLGLAFLNRGYDLRVGTPFGELLSHALERSAELCVQACPTGALAFRRRSRENPKTGRTEP
jgi:ferredoxin